jgi:TIR domain
VFKDVNAIRPGDDWTQALDETIATCDIVVAVIGPTWLATVNERERGLADEEDWLRRELEHALARAIPVVPTLVGEAELPAAAELPETLRPLLKRQKIELHDASWNSDVRRLVKALKEVAERLRDSAETRDAADILNEAVKRWQAVPRRARTIFLIALAALVVVLLGIGFVFEWALVAAGIAAAVWLVAKFKGNLKVR